MYEVDNEEDLDVYFYKKKTYTGTYHQNACKDCVKKEHSEKYAEGKYNYRKKNKNKYLDTLSIGGK